MEQDLRELSSRPDEGRCLTEANTGSKRLDQRVCKSVEVVWGRGWGTGKTFTGEGVFENSHKSWRDLVLEVERTPGAKKIHLWSSRWSCSGRT